MAHALTIGDRFELLDVLGTGAMGSVWRAWDRRTRSWVALKVLDGGRGSGSSAGARASSAASLLRFVQEQALRVDHPHVATPLAWTAGDDGVAYAMPLAHGGSLADLMREQRTLPEPLVAELLDQLLRGLSAVHGAGIVHRDLKPANLLLDATGTGRPRLRIGDFGVAAHRDGPRLTHVPGLVGTPGWAAPEQAAGGRPDPRHDLYAVGVLGVHLLSGLSPRSHPGTAPPGPLQPVLSALLAPDVEDRPVDAAAARTLLHRAGLRWSETGVVVPDRVGPAPRMIGRHPARAVGPAAGTHARTRTLDRRRALTAGATLCLSGSVLLSATAVGQALLG